MNQNTGAIALQLGAGLDYEEKSFYAFKVRVRDSKSLFDDAFVQIYVADVNEQAISSKTCNKDPQFASCMSVTKIVLEAPLLVRIRMKKMMIMSLAELSPRHDFLSI